MISEWEDTLFKDAIEINPSYTLKKGGRFKKISMANLEPFVRRPSNYEVAKFNGGSKFKNGDTLVARITPCLENGKTCYVDILTDEEVGFGSTEFIVLRGREGISDNVYVYYLALLPEFRNICIKSMMGTSGRQRAQIDAIANWRFRIPKIGEQKEIATLLSSLDDKIELNRQMNRTLEAVAQTLFKSWFVDFDPVWAKKEGRQPFGMDADTAALFPDEFEESEWGLIPAGWRTQPLPDVIEINPPRTLARGTEAAFLDMANMPIASPRALKVTMRTFQGSGAKFMNGDVLVARITPSLENGKTAFVDFLHNGEVGWGSTEYIVLKAGLSLVPEYVYYLARHESFRTFAIQNMTGTSGRQRVPSSCFDQYAIVMPNLEVMTAFGKLTHNFLRAMKAHDEESQTLVTIRDTLLPKLLSGELRVPFTAEDVLTQEVTPHGA